jgi:hypothetical protein
MAVYKIFPEKDTFISSYRSTQNFGRDEILEISNETEITALNADINRALIQFPTSQITDVITNIISGSIYSSSLRLFLANATLPIDYTIEAYPLSQSWDMGLGKSSDNPITTLGCTWISRTTTSNWASTGSSYINTPSSSQSFNYISDKDINMNVTSIVNSWVSSSIPNNGFLLKLSSSIENSTTPLITKFFSMDTHTIYPPQLEFKWNDSIYSSSLIQVTSSDFIPVITNNKSEFEENTVYTFKIKARDRFPVRAFQTSSVYLNAKVLPSSSYWALKDVKTEEMVIDFDTTFTKISCNNVSNYFKMYMNGLEPERYYQILYKTTLSGGETIVIDDKSNYFKVVR